MKNISVIIPVYNEEKYLPDFLKQLMNYWKNDLSIMSIIFVDDGSTDKTAEILNNLQKKTGKITVITNKKNTRG